MEDAGRGKMLCDMESTTKRRTTTRRRKRINVGIEEEELERNANEKKQWKER